MLKLQQIAAGLLITTLVGCAAAPAGPQFSKAKPASPEKALVYIYRPNGFFGGGITFPVLLNNTKIADIGKRGFFAIELTPGTYSIHTDTDAIDDDLSLKVDAGTTTFLRLNVHERPAFCFCTSMQFETVIEPIALVDLKSTREETTRVYFKNKL